MIHSIPSLFKSNNVQNNQAQYYHQYGTQIPQNVMAQPAQYSPGQVMQPTPTCVKRQNIIILSWDDTLFPRSVFEESTKLGTVHQMATHSLTTVLRSLFEQMIKVYGNENIYIVTDRGYDWIYNVCPQLDHFGAFIAWLNSKNISIISAKHEYQQKYPNDPQNWKECAFGRIYQKHFKNKNDIHCVTSVGDQMTEYYASYNAAKAYRNAF